MYINRIPRSFSGVSVGGNDANTVLLLNCDGADASTTFTDSSIGGSTHTITAIGSAQVDTAVKKWGTASLLCDGAGDYVSVPAHSDFQGSGPFTVDFWFRYQGDGGYQSIYSYGGSSGPTKLIANIAITPSDTLEVVGGGMLIVGATTLLDNTLHHLAFMGDGNVAGGSRMIYLYIDGVLEGSKQLAYDWGVYDIWFGSNFSFPNDGLVGGNMDEIRYSNIERWTSNFTPPTGPYSVL